MKNMIVTGCANGIGRYLFEIFKTNYNVYGIDKNFCNLPQTYKIDLSDYKKLEKTKIRDVNVVLNVAGVCPRKPYHHFSDIDFNNVFNNNVKSMFNICKFFYDTLIENRGSIINVSSVHSISTLQDYGMYAMTKGAVESFTRGLAVELADFDVTVNCIRLGPVDTSMLRLNKKEIHKIPLKRIVTKYDIYSIINSLIKNKSITGSVFTVDCGMGCKLSVEM